MNFTLSIIVCAYNAELYLPACLNSILTSTYQDFEVLLIDDGSTDGTDEICDRFGRDHKQVRVFHTENQGVPSARNVGIENAIGEYVGFVDADDLIAPNMYEMLVSAMKPDVQMSSCRFQRGGRDSMLFAETEDIQAVVRSQIDTAEAIIRGVYGPYVWNKLYRKEILDRYRIRFRLGSQGAEDQFFNTEYMVHCQKAAFLPEKMYGYVTTAGSITSTFRTSKAVSQKYVSLPRSWRFTAEVMRDISGELEVWSRAKTAMFYQTVLRKLETPDIEYIAEAISYVKKNKNTLLRYKWGIKYYLSAQVLCLSYSLWARFFRRGIE